MAAGQIFTVRQIDNVERFSVPKGEKSSGTDMKSGGRDILVDAGSRAPAHFTAISYRLTTTSSGWLSGIWLANETILAKNAFCSASSLSSGTLRAHVDTMARAHAYTTQFG